MRQLTGKNVLLAAGVGFLLSFSLTIELGAQQNQSLQQTHPPQVSAPLAEAQSALMSGDAESAIRILSTYLQSQPQDSTARTMLGQACASTGQNDRAEEELNTVLQSEPDNYIALAALGEIYERTGQSEKAEPLLAHAARASHGVPQIRMEWAVVLAHLHKYEEAQTALAGLSPPSGREESVGFHRLKASVALGLGNTTAAAAEMEKALALKPTDPALALATSVTQLQSKNWKRAASLAGPLFSRTHDPKIGLICLEAELQMHADFHQTLEMLRATHVSPTEELAFRQRLAELLISHGKFSDSIEDLKMAASVDPGRPELQFNLSLAQFRAGRYDDALESAEKCKELADDADLEDLIGDIQEALGDNLAAIKGYQAAVALATNDEKYRLSLAVELIRHNNFDAATVVLKQAEELQPKSWRIQLALGMVEHFAKTDEEATRYLLRAAELAPDPQSALQYLGDIQLDRPSAPDPAAVTMLCENSDRQPANGHLQFYCGAVMFRRDYGSGDKSNADEILKRLHTSARLLPKEVSSHCELGKAYRWLERWQEALSESETCARLDPDSAEAHFRLAQIYQHLGKTEQRQKEMKLYEAASSRVADENARRDATLKTFLYTIQSDTADQK